MIFLRSFVQGSVTLVGAGRLFGEVVPDDPETVSVWFLRAGEGADMFAPSVAIPLGATLGAAASSLDVTAALERFILADGGGTSAGYLATWFDSYVESRTRIGLR